MRKPPRRISTWGWPSSPRRPGRRLEEHRQAIQLVPQFALAYDTLGIALQAKKDLDGASPHTVRRSN